MSPTAVIARLLAVVIWMSTALGAWAHIAWISDQEAAVQAAFSHGEHHEQGNEDHSLIHAVELLQMSSNTALAKGSSPTPLPPPPPPASAPIVLLALVKAETDQARRPAYPPPADNRQPAPLDEIATVRLLI